MEHTMTDSHSVQKQRDERKTTQAVKNHSPHYKRKRSRSSTGHHKTFPPKEKETCDGTRHDYATQCAKTTTHHAVCKNNYATRCANTSRSVQKQLHHAVCRNNYVTQCAETTTPHSVQKQLSHAVCKTITPRSVQNNYVTQCAKTITPRSVQKH